MILPKITNKQKEIIKLILQFRFLSSNQIQQFLHHIDKKRINTWLKDLKEKGYIERIYDKTIVGKNRIAAIYYLDKNGIRFLKTQTDNDLFFHKLYYEKNRSQALMDRSLLIATICCQLEKKKSDILSYEYVTESDLLNSDSEFQFLKEDELTVDLCFSKKLKGKKMQYFLLTYFDETLPKYRIRKRIRDYIDFYFSNVWENNIDTPFPTILLVFQTKKLMIYTKRYSKIALEENEDDLAMNFATSVNIQMVSISGEIWE